MENNLTIEDLKQSVEYLWRKYQIKQALYLWMFFALLLLVYIFCILCIDTSMIQYELIFYCCVMGIMSVIILIPILIQIIKIKYFLKNYKKFSYHEVILDNFSTSYFYKRAVYYSVKINDNNVVNTSPYFSNSIFSKFTPEEYNNKKVIGLYDDKFDKFYVIKKID